MLVRQICVTCENYRTRIVRITRIFTDLNFLSVLICMIRLIRVPFLIVVWPRYVLSNDTLLADILIPQLRSGSDEIFHEFDAFGVVQNLQLDAA